MNLPRLFENCQDIIKREHESWNSYFTKWEAFAKYEEEIPENELFDKLCNKKKSPRKKVKKQFSQIKRKTLPLLSYKKNVRSRKNLVKKKKFFVNNHLDTKVIEQCGFSAESVGKTQNDQLEEILKSVFLEFLRENSSKVHIFAVLSHVYPSTETNNAHNFFLNSPESLFCNDSQLVARNCLRLTQNPSSASVSTVSNIFLDRNIFSCTQNSSRSLNQFECYTETPVHHNELRQIQRKVINDSFSNFSFRNNLDVHHFSLTNNSNDQSLQKSTQINLNNITSLALLNCGNYSKPLKWDLAHKYFSSTCRRTDNGYFNKKVISKMNFLVHQNGEKLEKLCSHKNTNDVSFSSENSNLVTPKRKPLERKCFSENVLKINRKHASKLFFDDEVINSDSDDQNENTTPIIFCKSKKLKKPVIKQVEEYDSDEYESIFDRVKKF